MQTKLIYKTPAGEQAVMAFYDSVLERRPIPYERLAIPTLEFPSAPKVPLSSHF